MKDIGHGKTARSLQIEATHRLADDDSHLEQTQAQRREAGPAKSVEFLTDFGVGCDLRRFSNGVTDLKEQPIGQRSQDEPKTVGLVEMTADSVAFKPTFKLTDVSFTATSTTVGHLVEQPGRKLIEIGDHESGIVPEHGHLRLSNDMARAFPGAGLIHKVDEDAGRLAALFSKLSGRLQGGLDRVKELAIASQSDEVSDLPERIIEVLETAVDGRAGKAGIGTNHHRAVRSMQYFDSRDDAFKPVLCVRGVMNTAGTKNDGDELTGLVIKEQKRVEDVASMVGIEGQLLLLPMAFKGRGVDVDGDLAPVVVERLDPGEKQLPLHRLKVRQRYCILKPAQRRLRGEVSLTGRTVTSCLEQRIFAQVLGVILIGIAKRDLDDPLQDLVITAVDHAALVALIRHQPCDEFAKPEPLFGLAKQHRSTIGGDVLGRKIDVDGKFGVEIEAGFRVTLCHEKRGCWRCGIRELHQQFTRVFRSRKALSGELFRLASADARRMILIDNVKGRQDSQKWEAMITAQEVTLRRLHHGSFMTPNRWIWCLTANLADLSTDLASRSVIIKIGRPQHGTDFHTAYAGFLDQHRDGLVADILAYLQSPAVCEIKNPSRWQSWERAVLSRMQDGSDLAALIRARRAGVDGDTSDALDARYVIETVLTSAGFDPRYHRVHIPTAMLCPAFSENMGERITGKSLWAHLTGLLRTAPLSHCEKGRPRIGGKKTSAGLIWDPPKAQGDLRRWSDGPPSEPGIGSIIGFPSRSIESSGPEMDQQAAGDPVEAVLPGGWTTEELNALIPDDE